jgi:hypothetical protein
MRLQRVSMSNSKKMEKGRGRIAGVDIYTAAVELENLLAGRQNRMETAGGSQSRAAAAFTALDYASTPAAPSAPPTASYFVACLLALCTRAPPLSLAGCAAAWCVAIRSRDSLQCRDVPRRHPDPFTTAQSKASDRPHRLARLAVPTEPGCWTRAT